MQLEENATNSHALETPLTAGQPFELKIVAVEKKKFVITFGDIVLQYEKADMPIWAVQYIVVRKGKIRVIGKGRIHIQVKGLKIPVDGEYKLVTVVRERTEI